MSAPKDRWELPAGALASFGQPEGAQARAGSEGEREGERDRERDEEGGRRFGRLAGWGFSGRRARLAAYLVAAAALGMALMAFPAGQRPRREVPAASAPGPSLGPAGAVPAATLAPPVPAAEEGQPQLERELESMLHLMEGVGGVRVFLTYESGPERVLATHETREQRILASDGTRPGSGGQESRLQRQVVIVRDNEGRRESPVVLVERHPRVRGVMVVAEGARDPSVRLAIQRAVAAALGIEPYRIAVQPRRR